MTDLRFCHFGNIAEQGFFFLGEPGTFEIPEGAPHQVFAAKKFGGNRDTGLATEFALEHMERARSQGATDEEIHDTVLVAAAFCMYSRYVDGLATWAPTDPEMYRENGKRLADHGYLASTAKLAGA